jgi:hypothetical protein
MPGPVLKDRREPGQRYLQGVVMKHRDANQRQREQDEFNRDTEQHGTFRRKSVARANGKQYCCGCRRERRRAPPRRTFESLVHAFSS